jgi:hypothetical protein
VAARTAGAFGDEDGRDELIVAAGRVTIAIDERRQLEKARAAETFKLDLGLQRQQVGCTIAGRRRGADVADQRAAILDLHAADLARRPLVAGK